MKQKLFGRLVAVAAVLLLSAATASAHSFEVDGIYYEKNSDGTSVSVTFKGSSYYDYSNEYSGAVTIPSEVTYGGTTYSVTSIGYYAFYGCSGLTAVSIGNSVTSIGDFAFQWCSGLTAVSIGNSVTEIGEGTFWGCSGLTSVEIPNSVTSIGSWAFYFCDGLESITVESGNIVYDSRDNCNAIIETATNTLLRGCKNTIIPNSVTSISEGAFANCSGLTSVEIPNSVTSIGKSAFSGCSGLTSVEIPNSVTSISEGAFRGCSGLTSVEIPNSVTSIGNDAFGYCRGLTSVSIGNSVTSIGYRAFDGCSGLKLVLFNAKNCSINNSVFSSSGLTLVIGADVEKIDGGLLTTSNANKIVTQAATPPVITAETFYDKSCPLYAPQGSYAKYWTTDIWEDFTDMRPIDNLITKIELNKSSLNLVDNYAQLSATITPGNATLSDIYWVSDNPAIASVDQNGKVTGLKTGITTITAMAIDGSGVKATCEVLFTENLTLNPSELTLAINQTAKITPVMTPDNATSTSLEWSTSNAGVAPFKANSDGSITVLGAADGVATITCRTTDGSDLTATCTVTVGTGAVDGIEADAVTVRAVNGAIRVEGAEGARVEVYTTAGVCIYSGTDTEIYVPQRGLYVVKVAGRATKLAL